MRRNANYDLMKIISMFLIVLYHIILHGKVLENVENPTLKFLIQLIYLISVVHVNSYVLVTGYFQSTKEFKFSKVWKLINATLFYRIVIMVLAVVVLGTQFSSIQWLRQLLPFPIDEYWFIKMYIILYCISPFLNIIVKHITKAQYKKLLFILFFCFSILPYVTGQKAFENNGYTLYQFVYLYFIGAYFRKYPIEKSYFGTYFTKNGLRLVLICLFVIAFMGNFCFNNTLASYLNINSIMTEVAGNMVSNYISYSNPFTLLQTISYFLFFGTLSFSNKWISKISACTIGVYLIHDHSFIRNRLYIKTGINQGPIISMKFLFYMMFVAIMIFIGCVVIEYVRTLVYKFIYNREISKKIREKYYVWLNSFRMEG